MNQTPHTPGEWCVCPGNKAGKPHIRIETRGEQNGLEPVATLTGPDREASAALIAAAPDLLAALEALFEHCAMVHSKWGDGCNREQANAAEQAARAAIAKARGGPNKRKPTPKATPYREPGQRFVRGD